MLVVYNSCNQFYTKGTFKRWLYVGGIIQISSGCPLTCPPIRWCGLVSWFQNHWWSYWCELVVGSEFSVELQSCATVFPQLTELSVCHRIEDWTQIHSNIWQLLWGISRRFPKMIHFCLGCSLPSSYWGSLIWTPADGPSASPGPWTATAPPAGAATPTGGACPATPSAAGAAQWAASGATMASAWRGIAATNTGHGAVRWDLLPRRAAEVDFTLISQDFFGHEYLEISRDKWGKWWKLGEPWDDSCWVCWYIVVDVGTPTAIFPRSCGNTQPNLGHSGAALPAPCHQSQPLRLAPRLSKKTLRAG